MSDQFTRITCGGSALPQDAPVVGLLFGRFVTAAEPKKKVSNNDKTASSTTFLQIVDADDIPTDRSETAKIQVSLHHAVFPQHEVVGWYRVGNTEEPTPEDLRLTQDLKAHYYHSEAQEQQQQGAEDKPFFFSLLQVRPAHADGKVNINNNSNTMKEDNTNDDDDDDGELPLNLYEVQQDVLVGVEDWSLETSEAERIAVERVVREKPQQDLKSTTTAAASTGGMSADIEAMVQQQQQQQPSAYVSYMSSVQQSLEAMDDRIQLIIDYLERMGKGEIPPNPSLMRQIQGLILQLGPLQQQAASSSSATPVSERDAALFSHLAAVAKTVQSVQSYTEKFRVLNDSRTTGGREGRRGY